MKQYLKAHLAVLAANIIYGVNFFVVKQVSPQFLHPYALSVIRATGGLFFLGLMYFFYPIKKIERGDFWKFVFNGLLGITINQTLLITGVSKTSSINASIIMMTNPLFVMLFASFLLKFPITITKIGGILIGFLGAMLIILSSGSLSISSQNLTGDIIILSNAILYGLYLVMVKPLMKKYDATTVMFWTFLFGTFFMFIWGVDELFSSDFTMIPYYIWLFIGFIVFFATFLTYFFNVYGLKFVNPSTVAVYINIQPIISSVMAVWITGEPFSWINVISMVLVFVGVYLVSKTNKEV